MRFVGEVAGGFDADGVGEAFDVFPGFELARLAGDLLFLALPVQGLLVGGPLQAAEDAEVFDGFVGGVVDDGTAEGQLREEGDGLLGVGRICGGGGEGLVGQLDVAGLVDAEGDGFGGCVGPEGRGRRRRCGRPN